MLIVGVFSPSQLDKLWSGHKKELSSFPTLSSLYNTTKDLQKDCLYTFKLDHNQDSVSRLLLKLRDNVFSLEPAALIDSADSDSVKTTPRQTVKDICLNVPDTPDSPPRLPWECRQQSKPSLLQSHCYTVLESAAEQEFSASFTPSKQRQEICREVEEYLLKSQLQTERRLAQIKLKKTPKHSPSPIRRRIEDLNTRVARKVFQTDEKLGCFDSDRENLTPNIKAKMDEIFKIDLTEDVREDLYLEEKCCFPEGFSSNYSVKTATRLDFRKPLANPVSAYCNSKTNKSAHSRSKSELQ